MKEREHQRDRSVVGVWLLLRSQRCGRDPKVHTRSSNVGKNICPISKHWIWWLH